MIDPCIETEGFLLRGHRVAIISSPNAASSCASGFGAAEIGGASSSPDSDRELDFGFGVRNGYGSKLNHQELDRRF